MSIDRLLAEARSGLVRLKPHDAAPAVRAGAFLHSGSRVPEAAHDRVQWIVIRDEGYSSSLAAASLRAIGLVNATDVVGGFQEWRAAGLPVTEGSVRPRLASYDLR